MKCNTGPCYFAKAWNDKSLPVPLEMIKIDQDNKIGASELLLTHLDFTLDTGVTMAL